MVVEAAAAGRLLSLLALAGVVISTETQQLQQKTLLRCFRDPEIADL